jgi:hypothetical protein
MNIQEYIVLIFLSLWLPHNDAAKVEVPISDRQSRTGDELRAYNLEEIEKLDKQIEEAYKNSYNRARLCSDRSNAYKELSLKKIDPIFRPCISKLQEMTRVPLVFPPVAPIPSYINDRKHYAYIDGYGIDINKYRVVLTWGIRERYQSNFSYVSGERLTPQFPSLTAIFERDYSDLKSLEVRNPAQYKGIYQQASRAISLNKGKIGYYIRFTCGAHCHGSYSSVLWEDSGYVYRVGIHMGGKKETIELANSTINNQY